MKSYSFQLAFETLWDKELEQGKGLLFHPLLMIWRQSVELALKVAILDLDHHQNRCLGHDLPKLFEALIELVKIDLPEIDDEYTAAIRGFLETVQKVDPKADRFRYTEKSNGEAFDGLEIDLSILYQTHWMIVVFCEGIVLEIQRGSLNHG